MRRSRGTVILIHLVTIAVAAAGVGLWFDQSGLTAVPSRHVFARIDAGLTTMGFGLDYVYLSGHRQTPDQDIYDALGLSDELSPLVFDVKAAKLRIEALPWVESARLTFMLPDGLAIAITERRPFALYQVGERFYVIDRTGAILSAVRADQPRDLPVVTGEGAARQAAAFHDGLKAYPEIVSRVSALARIGDRRWTLRLRRHGRGTLDVLLPAAAPLEGVATVAALHQRFGLLDKNIDEIDVRTSAVSVRWQGDTGASGHDGERGIGDATRP